MSGEFDNNYSQTIIALLEQLVMQQTVHRERGGDYYKMDESGSNRMDYMKRQLERLQEEERSLVGAGYRGTAIHDEAVKAVNKLSESIDKLSTPESLFNKNIEKLGTFLDNFSRNVGWIQQLDSIANKWVHYIYETERISLSMAQTLGTSALSGGDNNYVSRLLSRDVNYEKAMLDNREAITKGIVNLGATTLGGLIGGVSTGGNPAGVMAGTTIASSFSGMISDLLINMNKTTQIELQKIADSNSIFMAYYKETLPLQRNIIQSQTLRGTIGDVYGLQGALLEEGKKYMGIDEMQAPELNKLMSSMGMMRQLGYINDKTGIGLAENLTGLSRATGLGREEILGVMGEIKMKLDTPIDQLVGRFMQLNNISKDLQMPLKQVISDMQQLTRDNQKYGFAQEQVMGLYYAYGEEIKKGIVSVSQLSEYMKGIADMGADKSIGASALLRSMTKDNFLQGYGGNIGIAGEMYDLISGADPIEGGTLLRMIANPTARYENDPKLSGIMQKYGLDRKDLQRMKPEQMRFLNQFVERFGTEAGGSLGQQKYVEEIISSVLGVDLKGNLFEQMMQKSTYGDIGTRGGITDMKTANIEGNKLIMDEMYKLGTTVNKTLEMEYSMRKDLLGYLQKFNKDIKTPLDFTPQALNSFLISIKNITSQIMSWSNQMSGRIQQGTELEQFIKEPYEWKWYDKMINWFSTGLTGFDYQPYDRVGRNPSQRFGNADVELRDKNVYVTIDGKTTEYKNPLNDEREMTRLLQEVYNAGNK